MKKLLLLFGIALLLFSCEKNDLTNSEKENNQDLMLKSGKPDQPGDNLKVFRHEDIWGWQLYDEENDLTAFVGADIRELCSGMGEASYDILNFQDIVKDKGDGFPRIHTLMKQEDVIVEVWEGPILFCSDVFSVDPVFTGTGRLVYTDNDLYAWLTYGDYINAFGLRLFGDGIKVIYHGMWDGPDLSTWKDKATIMLK